MMHYFLGMEVCVSADGIFLGQGKYVAEIIKRFRMMDCKEMAIVMDSNLKLLSDASLEKVDAMMYHRMIFSLMYLVSSMELDYTFWQGAFRKNTKMYLDREIFKPSIKVITPRSRV